MRSAQNDTAVSPSTVQQIAIIQVYEDIRIAELWPTGVVMTTNPHLNGPWVPTLMAGSHFFSRKEGQGGGGHWLFPRAGSCL